MEIEKIAQTLKSEFIGIDEIIDRIIHSTHHWLLGKEVRSPIVVCLWGMTGSGKTHLVNRFIELAGFRDQHQYFSMGELRSIRSLLDEDTDCITSNKSVIVFDEFHRCNTRAPEKMRERVERSELENIWALLDTGILRTDEFVLSPRDANRIFYEIQQVSNCPQILVKKIPEINKAYHDNDNPDHDKINNIRYLNDPDLYYPLVRLMKKEKLYTNLIQHDDFLNYTLGELIEFYESLITKRFPRSIDYHNSLIFVMGNLDLLYRSSMDMSPNVECENLHNKFRRYGIHDAKEVLTQLFDPEQIARLGCNHLLYVPFSMKQYREITQKYLNEINSFYGTKMMFQPSVVSYILNEGLFPTQGVRSVISAIKNILEPLIHEIQADFDDLSVKAKVKNGRLHLSSESKKQSYSLLRLRCSQESVNEDLFLRISIHEAGHAILYHHTVGLTPRGIFIDQSGGEAHGAMQADEGVKYLTLTEIKNKVLMLLGGIASELVVYGEHSLGGRDDLKRATEALTQAKTKFGMYSDQFLPTRTEGEDSEFYKNENHQDIEEDLKKLLEQAKSIIRKKKSKLVELTELIKKKGRVSEKELSKILPPKSNQVRQTHIYERFKREEIVEQEPKAAYTI